MSVIRLIVIVLCAFAIPPLGAIICAVCLLCQVTSIVVRVVIARTHAPRPVQQHANTEPVFSIHVAIHNEPPALVNATLATLARQTWALDGYEVIVIDNNTTDPDLWRPVRDTCRLLGPNFRFLHRMGVSDAKAGALNIALSETRADATHIVTVDADYQVVPQFLAQAAAALEKTGADYVQFPQAYHGCDTVATGVDCELEEYFRTHARLADDAEAVLLTGTLCVISRSALVAAGGWSGLSTTEDAEMGVRLCRAGYAGRFMPVVVGRGLLPFSLRDLEQQRHRWASGNLQTLIAHAPAILLGRDDMGWRRRGAILSQLSAWLNFALIPAAILLLSVVWGGQETLLLHLAAASVVLAFADIAGRLLWRGLHDRTPFAVIAAAVTHRIALAPTSGLATIEVLVGKTMTFVVTDKFGMARGQFNNWPIAATILFIVAAISVFPAREFGALPVAAILILMLPLPAGLLTTRTLDRYRQLHSPSHRGVVA